MILRIAFLLFAAGCLAFIGCRKKDEPKPETAPPQKPATEPATAGTPPTVVVPGQTAPQAATTIPMSFPGAGEQSKINSPLTGAVARFHDKFRRFPRDWNELVTAGFIQSIPQPPAGKKFAIDPDTRIVVELAK